ncbi:MAG TPA: hypothetical protein VFV05_15560 [Methylomirabilota bacterium]|nr:hypothetical protein [Methylomirabilota bacterium]
MALRLDPMTGQMVEEDEDPALGLPARPMAPLEQGPGAAAPAAPPPQVPGVVVQPPPDETHTRTSGWERKGPQENRTFVEADPGVTATREKLAEAQGKQVEALKQEHTAALQKHDADIEAAEAQRKKLEAEAEAERKRTEENSRAVAAAMAEDKRRQAEMEKAGNITSYWADRSTGSRVLAGILVGLSSWAHSRMGGQGPSPAYKILQDAIAQDHELKLQRFRASKDYQALSAEEKKNAETEYDRQLTREDRAKEKLATAQAGIHAKKSARPGLVAGHEKLVAELEAKNAENDLKDRQFYAVKVTREGEQRTQRGGSTDTFNVRSASAAGGQLKPSSEDLSSVASLSGSITGLRQTADLIDKNPKAWSEVRQNNLDWRRVEAAEAKIPGAKMVRGVGQLTGVANVAPEEGLKSVDAKAVHRQVTATREAIAKMSGGVITDSDRTSADNRLALAAVSEPREAAKLLREVASDLGPKLDLILQNRQIAVPAGVLPTEKGKPAPEKPTEKPKATSTDIKPRSKDAAEWITGARRWLDGDGKKASAAARAKVRARIQELSR